MFFKGSSNGLVRKLLSSSADSDAFVVLLQLYLALYLTCCLPILLIGTAIHSNGCMDCKDTIRMAKDTVSMYEKIVSSHENSKNKDELPAMAMAPVASGVHSNIK